MKKGAKPKSASSPTAARDPFWGLTANKASKQTTPQTGAAPPDGAKVTQEYLQSLQCPEELGKQAGSKYIFNAFGPPF